MIFEIYCSGGRVFHPKEIISYEITSEVSAACDGLRLYFNYESGDFSEEIISVKVYDNEILLFNGFCDKQQITAGKSGTSIFVYARSTAALLVDNEAVPCEYSNPSSRQLCFQNAEEFGFECRLLDVLCEGEYRVLKGTSRFAAVNDFMQMIYGSGIYVSPQNEIKVFKKSSGLKTISEYEIISACRTINRSEVLSGIDYKINSDEKYRYHLNSKFAQEKGIVRKRLINLSSLPAWQRSATAERKIKTAVSNYFSVEITLKGSADIKLFDKVFISINDISVCGEFYVYETVKSKNKNGKTTYLALKKDMEEELLNYVD
ncbi:MAG: hypothetical protein LUG21_07545 [Clostridiales bacterium]|nr:hypothetical protein [Clostridiales bacterium]